MAVSGGSFVLGLATLFLAGELGEEEEEGRQEGRKEEEMEG